MPSERTTFFSAAYRANKRIDETPRCVRVAEDHDLSSQRIVL